MYSYGLVSRAIAYFCFGASDTCLSLSSESRTNFLSFAQYTAL